MKEGKKMLFTPMTRKAMTLAYNAHHGQTDKSGVPYIFHPARVAAEFTSEAEACVAWLHDVVEDTDYTIEDIRLAGFGAAICEALQMLTHKKHIPYMEYVKDVARNPIARAVKLADLQDNMDTSRLLVVDQSAEKRIEKYRAAVAYLSDLNANE
jgi:(p)ppGpp synthase/HD superfamily hydrolase